MRFDGNSWQEGAGLFIKKANANPYSVVAAYLGELEKIADPLKRLAMIEEAIAQRLRSGVKPTEEMVQQARSLRGALQENAEAEARRPRSVVGPGSPALPGTVRSRRAAVRGAGPKAVESPRPTTGKRKDHLPHGHGKVFPADEAERFGTPRAAQVAPGEGEFSDRAALYGKDNFNRPGDVSDEAIAAFEAERGAIDQARPVAVASMDGHPGFRSQREILGGSPEAGPMRVYRGAQGLDPAARGPGKRSKNTVIPLDEATAADDLRGAQRLDMGGPRAEPDVSAFAADEAGRAPRGAWSKVGLEPEEIPEVSRGRSVRLASNRPAPREVDRPTTLGARFDEVDRPTSVSMQAQDFLGQADALTQASAEAARKGDFEGSRRLAVQASSFEREFESISQARRGQAFRAGPSVEQVRGGEPTAAMAQDPRTAIQAGRKQVTDATVVERPMPEATVAEPAIPNMPDSAVVSRQPVKSRPPPALQVTGTGRAARVQRSGQEVIPESVARRPKSMDDVMGPSARSSPEEALAQGRITQQQYDSMRPQAAAEAKPAYVPPPPGEQNVLVGGHDDPRGALPTSQAVEAKLLKPNDEHTGFKSPGITKDPPAQMAPQPVDAPSTPMDIQQGANNPMAPTPEAPVAVAPVWKRRAALAGASTLAAGGAFGVGYGGRQVLQQPQQGQR